MSNLKIKSIEVTNYLTTNLENILESLSQGLILADDKGKLFYANSKFTQIVGYPIEEVLGKRVYELFLSPKELDDASLISAMHKRYEDRMNGISETYELEITRKDGETRWLEISAAPLKDSKGKIIGSIGVNSDITRRKELENQLRWSQKMEVIGKLAGGLAHDFNNLLTVISGYANLLSSVFKIGEKSYRHVQAIKEASQMASALTKQLLTVSRQQVLQLETSDLNKIVLGSLNIVQNLVGPDITVSVKLEEGLPPILADTSQIQQILINLALNSRDAMNRDGRLSIKTYSTLFDDQKNNFSGNLPAGNYAVLSVSDNGCGISEKVKKHLFEPFFTTKKKGNGLGLSTVYGIVGQHNGSISVKSEVGVFSTFEIFLPLSPSSLEIVDDKLIRDVKISNFSGSESILLVEDEIEVIGLIKEVLVDLGYKVTSTTSSRYALTLLTESAASFDLLLSDVVMPDLNGFELAERAIVNNQNIKIILMSGCIQDINIPENIRMMKIPFILKPFDLSSLSQKVRLSLDDNFECPILAKAFQEI